jgi:hypothetical protein
VLANIAYQAGTYLFSFVGSSTMAVILSIAWGLVILAILILRVRNILHAGLMEAALERSAREGGAGEVEFCAQCEMPLLEHAAFCNACGTAVRVQPKAAKAKVAIGASGASTVDAATIIPGMDDATYEAAGTQSAESTGRGTEDPPPDQTAAEDPARRSYDEEGRA